MPVPAATAAPEYLCMPRMFFASREAADSGLRVVRFRGGFRLGEIQGVDPGRDPGVQALGGGHGSLRAAGSRCPTRVSRQSSNTILSA